MIFKLLINTTIKGRARKDLQNAEDTGPTSLILTNNGLTPKHAAPKINVTATNQIGGFLIKIFNMIKTLVKQLIKKLFKIISYLEIKF